MRSTVHTILQVACWQERHDTAHLGSYGQQIIALKMTLHIDQLHDDTHEFVISRTRLRGLAGLGTSSALVDMLYFSICLWAVPFAYLILFGKKAIHHGCSQALAMRACNTGGVARISRLQTTFAGPSHNAHEQQILTSRCLCPLQ